MNKKVCEILSDFVDVVSKNGAFLLNIGPRADGSIPKEDAEILREIGKWLSINGEGIYETRHWKIFGEGPTEISEGRFGESGRKDFTSEDIRFTFKAGVIYAFALKWPENGVVKISTLRIDSDIFLIAFGSSNTALTAICILLINK